MAANSFLVRTRVVPRVIPFAARFEPVRRLMFRTLSQIAINYRGGALASGKAGSVHGGDRLPWVSLGPGAVPADNHAVLDGLNWQVHVYGTPAPGLAEACRAGGLAQYFFEWDPVMGQAGFARNALYLVRPDGHVAHAAVEPTPAALARGLLLRAKEGRT